MELEYWQKQLPDKPLFEDILWSRPQNKTSAGKLLIVGGNAHEFAAVAEAFAVAEKAGAGVVHVLMPDSLKKTVGQILESADYAPSTPSGSFASEALNELLTHAAWADLVLIAGDLGRNSETAVLLDKFIAKYHGPLVLTKDSVNYLSNNLQEISARPDTTLVLSLSQLQKLGTSLKFETPFLLSMGMVLLVQALHAFTKKHDLNIVTKELANILVATQGRVSSTKLNNDRDIWRVEFAAKASVFWMQNSIKPFEAITTSLVD